jgi:MoxR-like ATPase
MIRWNPGTGKTHLTTVFATLIGCPYSRIQWTSDLMPADIIWSQIYNRETQNFLYRRWPLYNHIVIVDELNRIPPKTQSAFLQAMQEKSLTLDQQTVLLEKPFMLIATINHNDLIGTYGLPQSLLDRFMIQSESQTLDHEWELQMLNIPWVDTLQSLRTVDTIRWFQNQIEDIWVDQTLQKVMIEHIAQLRMIYPFSSRAVEHLYKMSKTWARCCGETKVSLHHIRDMSSLLMIWSKK